MGSNSGNDDLIRPVLVPYMGHAPSGPNRPLQPRNLQGLLRFAVEATRSEDAPGGAEAAPMSEERRRFLEEVLGNLSVNVAETMQRAIEVLTDRDALISLPEDLPDNICKAFEDLMDYTDDIDAANDFYKLGGFRIFPECFNSSNIRLRCKAYALLAQVCQNNPFCQEKAMSAGLLNLLFVFMETEMFEALAKCISAVSSIVRENPTAAGSLLLSVGAAPLLRALQGDSTAKAAFLLRHLASQYPQARNQLLKAEVVKVITEQLTLERNAASELLLDLLNTLVTEDPRFIEQCKDPTIDLEGVIEEYLENPELEDDTFIEEKEYCRNILRLVLQSPAGPKNSVSPNDPVIEEADR